MSTFLRARSSAAACVVAWALVACGGGGSGSSDTGSGAVSSAAPVATVPTGVGAPTATGNIPTDGLNWINYRRGQAGMPMLTHNSIIDKAAQAHSDYQKANNIVSHNETAGMPGFTGISPLERLTGAGYNFGSAAYAYGEVISATSSNSGFYMSEELITAIYHRFVIFEPKFKEIGTGAATTAAGYTYFTSDFTSANGYGPGVGRGMIVTWPVNNQTGVTTNFFSDYESPDPVAGVNEVGYPVSVHADITATLAVSSFTLHARGGANLDVKLLQHATDSETPLSAAAIVPLAVLKPATIYDVSFSGKADGVDVSRSWSFTTK